MTEQKPRILVLFGSAVIFGAERGNLEALMALKAQGAEILCLIRDEAWSNIVPPALDARGIAWRKVPYVEQWRHNRAHVVLLRGPWAWLVANWRFLKAVREFQPTHIHAYSQLFVLNFLPGLMLVKTPLVYRAGDEPTLHNWFWRLTWRYVVKRTANFVAISKFVARLLKASSVDASRISVIYNHPPTRIATSQQPLDLAIGPSDFAICYVGQLIEEKGPHLIVDALRALAPEHPSLKLVLIGRISEWSGDQWARSLREETLRDDTIKNRVMFTGYLDDAPSVVAQCKLLVAPSLCNEGLGSVVMEAKNVSRPSIVFPNGGLPEMIEQDVDGLICREPSLPALVEAIRAYLDNPEQAAVHGTAARVSLQRFGIAEFGQKWADVYAKAAGPVPAQSMATAS